MQYLQSPPELLNLGTYTEGDHKKGNFYAKWQIESVWQGLVHHAYHREGTYFVLSLFFFFFAYCVVLF